MVSSEKASKDIIRLLFIKDKSIFFAPFIDVSSSAVKIISKLGCERLWEASNANIYATPIPLSAPILVSFDSI